MSRLLTINPSTATGKSKDLLDAVKSRLGRAPNMTKIMANSPAVLQAYLGFSGALAEGLLDPKIREQIALLTAQENQCDYCLSSHSATGKMAGLAQEEVIASRDGIGTDERATAALTFARRVLENRGRIGETDVAAARAARFSDGEIAEIIAHVSLNVFTNYFNVATEPDLDFPKVHYAKVA